ncbi:MAG: exodeoxyribonuclease III [Proteobacteria bacterium]|nr:exodeoxyribonuclease III [Pseudomonadota bacterium]
MTIRIATWNINSVRIRLGLLARLAQEASPDIVCLQETKVTDDLFPAEEIAALGYRHQHIAGQKGYNGVAILSRLPLAGTGREDWCAKGDCRHIRATLPNGVVLHNFYVPAGGDIPDPDKNDKFAHKLQFLREMAAWWDKPASRKGAQILVGDLNIAPLETDVWSHKQLLKIVSHTPIEVDHLDKFMAAGRWVDAVRRFIPPEEKLYTWWSYRARDWDAADKGRRLDHVWVTPPLVDSLRGAEVLRAVRGWEKPSDHVPVIVDLAD